MRQRFDAFIRAQAPDATLERVPMLRGRIVAANGVPVEQLNPAPSAAWVLQSDRGITYADEVPAGSRVVEGEWWQPDYHGPPLVSFEKKVADGLGLKIGDPVTVNVLGRNITARIANLRTLDWQSLGINFVMVFSPATFRGAPRHRHRDAHLSGRQPRRSRRSPCSRRPPTPFPAITTVRVREALDAVGTIVDQPRARHPRRQRADPAGGRAGARRRARGWAPPPGLRRRGAQDAGRHARAAARRLCARISPDRAGDRASSASPPARSAAGFVVTKLMNLSFAWLPGPALAAAAGAVAATVVLGLIGTFSRARPEARRRCCAHSEVCATRQATSVSV